MHAIAQVKAEAAQVQRRKCKMPRELSHTERLVSPWPRLLQNRKDFTVEHCSRKYLWSIQSSSTSIRVLVKECRPGSATHVSHPHAAIISVIEFVRHGTVAAAAGQQSKRRSVSDFDCSNRAWQPFHSKELWVR